MKQQESLSVLEICNVLRKVRERLENVSVKLDNDGTSEIFPFASLIIEQIQPFDAETYFDITSYLNDYFEKYIFLCHDTCFHVRSFYSFFNCQHTSYAEILHVLSSIIAELEAIN